jgi:hypothetical protein
MDDRHSINVRIHHHFPSKFNRKYHSYSGLERIPSVPPIRTKRRRYELDILHGDTRKLKPQTFDGENRKGE